MGMTARGNPFWLPLSSGLGVVVGRGLGVVVQGLPGVGVAGVGLVGVGVVGLGVVGVGLGVVGVGLGVLSTTHLPLLQTLPLPQVVPSRAGCVPLALTPLEHTSSSHMFCGGRVRKG